MWDIDFWGSLGSVIKPPSGMDSAKEGSEVRIVLAPGKNDRSPKSVKRGVTRYRNEYRADIVLGTEYQYDDRFDAFAKAMGGDHVRGQGKDGMTELAIALRPGLNTIGRGAITVTKTTYKRVGGAVAPPKGLVWVTTPNGLTTAVMHLANTVGNTSFTNAAPARNQSWKESVINSAKWASKYDHLVLGADFNAQLGRPNQLRTWLDSAYREVGLHRVKGINGICGFYVKGFDVTKLRNLGMTPASDHAAWLLVGKVTK